jgi:hypothetical protein
MNLRFALLSSSVAFTLGAVACGGISDPTRNGDGRVATVSGALTGITVPANARVALVYRRAQRSVDAPAAVEVASDVPVVGGKFTMNLGMPADTYFAYFAANEFSRGGPTRPPRAGTDTPVPEQAPSGGSSGSSGAFGAGVSTKLAPRDIVSGGITEPMAAAIAGFVVYADTNGNGKLDLDGQYAASSDEILGGNKELMLVYLKGGGSLDYEKLRDKSGILPANGFNLMWSEGRWLPLNLVELKLGGATKLPSAVCSSAYSGYTAGGSSSGSSTDIAFPAPADPDSAGSSGSSGSGGTSGYGGYPSPTDPGLKCSPDGTSFSYSSPSDCPPSPPQPVGLCAGDVYETTACASGGYGSSLPPGQPIPDGWPCPVAGALDGGAADASFDGGSADGGSADGG